MPLNRHDEPGQMFEASEISCLRKERPTLVCESDTEDEDEGLDDTLEEYCSEEDGGAIVKVDSDDEQLFFFLFLCVALVTFKQYAELCLECRCAQCLVNFFWHCYDGQKSSW